MDILTPKGQETAEQEREAASLFCSAYPRLSYIHTPKDQPSAIDAVIANGGVMLSAVECKCRQMTLEHFTDVFDRRWLVTMDKLESGKALARMLCVPLVGFLYLVPSKTLLIQRLWDANVGWAVPMDVKATKTQATVNGGTAFRRNAFVDMRNASILPPAK